MSKMKTYTPKDFPVIRGKAILTFCDKGSILFSKAASFLLKIEKGSQVVFMQDETNPSDWYITKVDTGGFEVKGNTLPAIHNTGLVNFISMQLKTVPRFSLRIGEIKDGVATLITSHLKK